MLLAFVIPASAKDALPAGGYKIVGYYIAWGPKRGYTPLDIRGNLLTHVNYAFANIRDGKVIVNDPQFEIDAENNFGKLLQLKKKYPHLRTLISIGGWTGSKNFSDVALTPDSRTRFADSAVDFIRRYGFDGVDIDWEFPVAGGDEGNVKRPEDKQNYTLLFQSLREKLDDAGKADDRTYLLTAAIGTNAQFLQNTEMAKVARILDFVNIMTYDFNGHWNRYSGHLAPLYEDPALQRADTAPQSSVSHIVDLTIDAGVPPAKLVLGMPFYGYSWKKCGAAHHGQNQDCEGKGQGTWEEGALDFSDIAERLVNKNGFVRYWNNAAKVPYLFNAETEEFVTYDDTESFDYKIKFLKSRGLAGAMFWEVTGDRKFILQKKAARNLNRVSR